MNGIYAIYLVTFLLFPIVGFLTSKYLEPYKRFANWALLFFVIHNILFLLGISLSGDLPDYIIFSLEYLFFCLATSMLYKSQKISVKFIRIIGTFILILGFLQGLLGILFFIVESQDYVADKTYNFNSYGKSYQTRRYSFGFATLDDTRFTFETYREFKFLPMEKLINKTNFFESKSKLNFRDNKLQIRIQEYNNKKNLEFVSANGEKYVTKIE